MSKRNGLSKKIVKQKNMLQAWDKAIDFITLNDEPLEVDFQSIRGYTTVILVSEIFGVNEKRVARAVLKRRRFELRAAQ